MRALLRQATALDTCCEPGGMLAVLADPALFAEDFLQQHSELAGINFASHFVVAARQERLAEIEAGLKRRNVTHQRLPVSRAFHSQWIDEAQAPFKSFMRSVRLKRGHLPLVCCDRAVTLSDLPQDYFWSVVRRPIRFHDTMMALEHDTDASQTAQRYIDVGPAGTLATFLKYGLPTTSRSTMHSILTPFGQDQKNLATLLASYKH
jgi:acyl transferase domain-containing protein